jgi:hypothetical protein
VSEAWPAIAHRKRAEAAHLDPLTSRQAVAELFEQMPRRNGNVRSNEMGLPRNQARDEF